jgi:glycosyl transferase family 25
VQLKAIVISLKKSIDRREFIIKQCNQIGIEYEILEGIDGRTLPENICTKFIQARKNAYAPKGLPPSTWEVAPGVVGCALSHINAYKKIVESNTEAALILEDDAILTDSIKLLMDNKKVIKYLRDKKVELIQLAAVKSDYIYLPEIKLLSRIKLAPGLTIGKAAKIIPGASCYIISKSGAQKLLDNILPLRYASDQILANCEYFGIAYYAAKQPLSLQNRELKSTITMNGAKPRRARINHFKRYTRIRKYFKRSILGFLRKTNLIPYFDRTFLLLTPSSNRTR